jgi:hypothetical protein
VKSAQLPADRNRSAEAVDRIADILALDPDWPDARNALERFIGKASRKAQDLVAHRKAQ